MKFQVGKVRKSVPSSLRSRFVFREVAGRRPSQQSLVIGYGSSCRIWSEQRPHTDAAGQGNCSATHREKGFKEVSIHRHGSFSGNWCRWSAVATAYLELASLRMLIKVLFCIDTMLTIIILKWILTNLAINPSWRAHGRSRLLLVLGNFITGNDFNFDFLQGNYG